MHYLDLLLVSSSDIRDGPTSLLLYALFVIIGQEVVKVRKSLVVDNTLSCSYTLISKKELQILESRSSFEINLPLV